MKIKTIEYLQSVVEWQKCPSQPLPEYAFIGRSNVGKSSLINMLANNKSIAKTSSKPGKTQTINHFLVDKKWFLVDLPGYGYATISKTMRTKWEKMIRDYFLHRENLQLIFVLVDARLAPQQKDIDFINQLGEMNLPFALVFTKVDKISTAKRRANFQLFQKTLSKTWDEFPIHFFSSAQTREGKEDILDYIFNINEQFYSNN